MPAKISDVHIMPTLRGVSLIKGPPFIMLANDGSAKSTKFTPKTIMEPKTLTSEDFTRLIKKEFKLMGKKSSLGTGDMSE